MKKNQRYLSRESGIIVGNIEKKDQLKNPISKHLVNKFDLTLFKFLEGSNPKSIHEVGCGEGRLIKQMILQYNVPIKGTDLSKDLISELKKKYTDDVVFETKSIYDLTPGDDSADVIVCCEVLEHLEFPGKALEALKSLNANNYIISVPREPIWRFLNVVRGKYIRDLGNTPGHLNHWSKFEFLKYLNKHGFEINQCKNPLPWTMVIGSFKKSSNSFKYN